MMHSNPEREALNFCLEETKKAKEEQNQTQLQSYFFEAAEKNWSEVLEVLIQTEAVDINQTHDKGDQPRNKGWTALTSAAANGQKEVVELLLEYHADINKPKGNGSTALLLAAENGYTDIVKILLDANAAIDQANTNGLTPLIQASGGTDVGHLETVRLLLTHRAAVNQPNNLGATPLFIASVHGNTKIAQLLLENRAAVDQPTHKDGVTPLIQATVQKQADIVRLLLDHKANVNHQQFDGSTALMIASQLGHADIVEILLQNGAWVHPSKPMLALVAAATNNRMNVVELLLPAINRPGPNGETALTVSAEAGEEIVVTFLLKFGVDVNQATADGSTALSIAYLNQHGNIVELLRPFINRPNAAGITPLMSAAQHGRTDIVECLIQLGADINQQRIDGPNALMVAAEANQATLVDILLQKPKILTEVIDASKEKTTILLDLEHTKGDAERIELIIATLKNHPTLSTLHIFWKTPEREQYVKRLIEGIQNNKTLSNISLVNNDPSDEIKNYAAKINLERNQPCINAVQKNIIETTLEFSLDPITEAFEKEPEKAILAFKTIMSSEKISEATKKIFEDANVWNDIESIRAILAHPCPQNRHGGDIGLTRGLQGALESEGRHELEIDRMIQNACIDGTIYYHGVAPSGQPTTKTELQGMLSLTAYNDSSAPPITKGAVVQYIYNLVEAKIAQQQEKLQGQSEVSEVKIHHSDTGKKPMRP